MKKLLLLIICIGFFGTAFSQEDTEQDDTDLIIEDLLEISDEDLIDLVSDLKKYHIILISAQYNSQAYFLGRDLGVDQYSIVPQLMYQNHNGIYLGVSGNIFSEFDPKWDFTILSGGYGLDFGADDNMRAELGYSRYIFSDSDSNDFENSLDGAFYINTKNNDFGTSVNASYLFGDRTGFQAGFQVFGNLKITDLNTLKSSTLNFEPSLSLIFGSENIDTSRIDNLEDFPFIQNVVNSFETFSLRNTQLAFPLVFDFTEFSVEAGYTINFPTAFEFERDVDTTGFFHLAVNYLIDLR